MRDLSRPRKTRLIAVGAKAGLDVRVLHAKIGQQALEIDFLEDARSVASTIRAQDHGLAPSQAADRAAV